MKIKIILCMLIIGPLANGNYDKQVKQWLENWGKTPFSKKNSKVPNYEVLS